MSNAIILHTVKQGERWDNLAYHYYGTVNEINRLIDANPHIPFCEMLPMGETLKVPVLEVKTTDNSDLPPWLQRDN
ncbi:Phage Tail Protein X [Actinobacillus ureae]|uniref:tail protein X n=1 Tax=Actinobacillus ureae TaxID=723 RepID=UPI000E121D52|nr:tail protein X [Actinobacillus ureae]SUT85847.1 Phage Tail Protein X [Actinobacillus ureae]SUT86151.1 Phage Tail Protein X [Actinobacillus ureae]SUU43954.1 Phage Tail Protein X [Actinobacillus ureae]SUU44909.1 Phage Tail Protein X [Actinobacillus ureae]